MVLSSALVATTLVTFALAASAPARLDRRDAASYAACTQIDAQTSDATSVVWPWEVSEYLAQLDHYMSTSTQLATCVVEAGTREDLGRAMVIIGQAQVPFAIKSGGHASNPGFSSTTGVHLSMSRFNQVIVGDGYADIGPCQTWASVYAALEPSALGVVGGRYTSVGVGGFLAAGGGYSWLSQQYGLGVDTVLSMDVVTPQGTLLTVSADANADLFFALRGGGNQFGIVTNFRMKTHAQTQVFGGSIFYGYDQWTALSSAVVDFQARNTDPKAQILFVTELIAGVPVMSIMLFYDAPQQPTAVFDAFLALPSLSKDVKVRPFPELVSVASGGAAGQSVKGLRGGFDTVSQGGITTAFMAALKAQIDRIATVSLLNSGTLATFAVEPFMPSIFATSLGGAWPHDPARPVLPFNANFQWLLPTSDNFWTKALKDTTAALRAVLAANGEDTSLPLYPNYAIAGTPVEQIYGANLDRLRVIRAQVDPASVMRRAGGFRV